MTTALALLTVLAAGCGGDAATADSADDKRIEVAAAFYPLQFVTERVGGDRVLVRSITKPGAEPHDVELTSRDVAAVQDADLVVYLGGFQPQVDDAVAKTNDGQRFDVAATAALEQRAGALDPHFWLDPARLADVGTAVAGRLATIDPAHKTVYEAGAATLRTDLLALDAQFSAGLRDCPGRNLVTSHTAFGYLAGRYQLNQVGIAGLDAEAEPTAADQAAAVDFARKNKVTTVFTEPLVSDAVAESVAREIGGRTATLDPLESIGKESMGPDYLAVMRGNLQSLRAGLGCR